MQDDGSSAQRAYDIQRMQANRAELAAQIARLLPEDGMVEPVPGLLFARASSLRGPLYGVSEPSFCVIAQGSKEVFLSETRYQYDPAHYLLTTLDLPVISQICEASKEEPYLTIRMRLDPTLVGSVLMDSVADLALEPGDVPAIDVSPLDSNLLDAVVRLAKLVESPADTRILAPSVMREIIYRLLMGAQGARLRHIGVVAGDSHRIARVIDMLRRDFRQPLRVEQISQELGMSVSALYHQFKAITAMSPLQYQKRLRLQEARRLILSENYDAASAGSSVGYYDAAHFSREYKSLFGAPPRRDVDQLRLGSAQMLQEG